MYRLYVEAAVASESEIYLGFVLGRSAERLIIVASAAGGTDIEEIVAKDPDSIVRINVEPAVGLQAFEAREIAFAVGLDPSLVPQAVQVLTACYRALGDLDATMLEINPLAVTADGRLLALDAKMIFATMPCSVTRMCRSCETSRRKIPASEPLWIGVSAMWGLRVTSAASSMARGWLWPRWT